MHNAITELKKNKDRFKSDKIRQQLKDRGGKKMAIDFSDRELPNALYVDVPNSVIKIGEQGKKMRDLGAAFIPTNDDANTIALLEFLERFSTDEITRVILDNHDGFKIKTLGEFIGDVTQYLKTKGLIVTTDPTLECDILVDVFGEDNNASFRGMVIDNNGKVICVGQTYNADGEWNAIAVKLDDHSNFIHYMEYNSCDHDNFNCVVIDHQDNIICAGSSALHPYPSLVKLSPTLTIIKSLGCNISPDSDTATASFSDFSKMTIDQHGNIFCVGRHNANVEDADDGYSALIVKLDRDLNMLKCMVYGGDGYECFDDVTIDANNDVVCIGHASSDSILVQTETALIVKFTNELDFVASKAVMLNAMLYLNSITSDNAGNYLCVGAISSKHSPERNCFVMKIDRDLTRSDDRIFVSDSADTLMDVHVDPTGKIHCAGMTTDKEYDRALVVSLDDKLSIGASMRYDYHVGTTVLTDIQTDGFNMICSGTAYSSMTRHSAGVVIRFNPSDLGVDMVGSLHNNNTMKHHQLDERTAVDVCGAPIWIDTISLPLRSLTIGSIDVDYKSINRPMGRVREVLHGIPTPI